MNFGLQQVRLSELVLKKLDGNLQAEEQDELVAILRSSGQAVPYYNEMIILYSGLTTPGKVSLNNPALYPTRQQLDTLLLNMAQIEKDAPALFVEKPKPGSGDCFDEPPREITIRKINNTSLFVAVASLAALLLMITYVVCNPRIVNEVATVTDTIDTKWGVENGIKNGSRLMANSQPIRLQSGAVRIVSDKDVELVLEGPAEFQFDSVSQVRLLQGRLYAKVSQKGEGFSVDTFNAKIVDLGTEFGIAVDANGDSLVQMHKGKASLVSGFKGGPVSNYVITEGQAGRVSSQTGAFKSSGFDKTAFLQGFNSEKRRFWRGEDKISLADIIGGGNGFGTGRYGVQIDTKTGRLVTEFPIYSTINSTFVKVSFSPFIDGLFVPDNKKGCNKVSSRGDIYAQCPETKGNFWGNITNGLWKENINAPANQWSLRGMVYGTISNPAIYLHSNKGITFDLQAMRSSISPLRITHFTSFCGISETAKQAQQFNEALPKASLYVLIDGQERFRKDDVQIQDGAIPVDIEIESEDKYLTLMTTNGSDDKTRWDWCLFAEPYLHIEP